ncbi:recombinase family protein [Ruminococcaceae bacterium OttesenSCG-928-L11]|nr:recombinase family protein [Ruminococcaceae bacterium OttesenSCG-928-L11]
MLSRNTSRINSIIVGESFDDNMSGMNFERPGIYQLSEAVEAGTIDAVVVKDLSRLGRHKTQTAFFMDFLHGYNVRVLSVTENIDSFDEDDDLIIGFKQVLNDFYAKDISRKIRFGYQQKQKTQGVVVIPPYGYYKDKNTNKVAIVEACAQAVREIYDLYIEGYGCKNIARTMSERGHISPAQHQKESLGKEVGNKRTKMAREYKWNERTIDRILTNEAYIGTLICRKTSTSKIRKTRRTTDKSEQYIHENYYPPIIDKAIWEQVQTIKQARAANRTTAPSNKPMYRYAGLLKCGECDASFSAKKRRWNGAEDIEYVCNTYHRMASAYCTPHRIKEYMLDDLLYEEVLRLKKMATSNWARIEEQIFACTDLNKANELRIEKVRTEIQSLKEENRNLLQIMTKYPERSDDVNEAMNANDSRIKELNQKAEEYKHLEIMNQDTQGKLKTSIDLLDDIIATRSLSNGTIRLLVDKIIIHQIDKDTLDVRFKMNGPYETHVNLWNQFEAMDRGMSQNQRAEAMIELVETLHEA